MGDEQRALDLKIEITKFTLLNFVFTNNSRELLSCRQKAYFESKRLAWAIIF